jgi:hypothetical protein
VKTRKEIADWGFLAAVLVLVLGVALSAHSQTVLIKMGDNQTFNGTNAPSPDIHGHYWNSVDSSQFSPYLTNIDGTLAQWAAFGFEVGEAGDTDANNGPAGPVPPGTPANCVIDTNALGNLGIKQAVYDYYVNSEFEIQNLYPTRTYTLTFFGSHSSSVSDYTVYSIFTNNAYTMLETAVSLYVQYPATPSVPNSNMVVSATVLPAANGTLYVQFLGTNTVNGGVGTGEVGGYLNCMQITEGPSTNTPPPATDLTKTILIGLGDTNTGGFYTTSPDKWGHYWNSADWNYFILTNAAGQATSMAWGVDVNNGYGSYNGPAADTNGFTTNPNNANVDTNALGYLGIPTAVSGYFLSTAVEIQGMNPTKQYALTFFGSMKYPPSEITTYSLCSDISYSTIITSVTLNVGSGANDNQDRLAVLSGVSPQSDGNMYIKFIGTNTTPYGTCPYCYPYTGVLNCMSIVDLSTNVIFQGPPTNQTVLLHFDGNYGYRGIDVPSPDNMGHYWNNLGTNLIGSPLVLTNAGGAATAMTFMFDGSVPAYTNLNAAPYYFGSDYYNGPSGPVQNPTNCVFNPSALGYLGVTNAVYSYFIGAHCILQNMNPAHQYSLTFFGSHKYSTDATTIYSVYSDSTYSTLIGSTNLFVGSGASYNEDTVAVIGPIYPSVSGSMYIDFLGANGHQGYLNCMQIVDLTPPPPPDPFTKWQSRYFTPAELGNPAYSGPNADPLGKGISNTNQFLAGFNPTNSAAYPHIISIVKANTTNLVITYLGASGDSTWVPGFASRTNVLEFTSGTATGSYSNNFVSTGQTNVLSGGTGLGTVASFIATNGVTGPARYYRVRVLVP